MRNLVLGVLAATLAALPLRAVGAEPVEITAILSLTGQQAFLGKEQADTFGLIEQSVNKQGGIAGRPLHFTIVDDQSSPQLGVQLATQAIARKDAVVVGPSLTAVCDAIYPLFKEGPVDWCFSPSTHPAPGGFVYGSGPPTTDSQIAAIRYFREKGWKRIAIIVATDASGQDAEKQLLNALALPENASMKLVDLEHFNSTDLSVAAQMARIKAADPQIFVAWGTGAPQGTLLRGLAEAGIDVPIYTSAANLTYAQMRQYAGYMPKVLLFPGYPWIARDQLPRGATRDAVNAFFDVFKGTGIRPDAGHATCYDGVMLVIDALRKLGASATPAQVRDYINSAHFVGTYGPYDFRAVPQRGLNVNAIVIARWDTTKDTWVGVSKPGGMP